MRQKPWNIIFHNLIGLHVHVLLHPDPSLRGLEGVVVDETARTLLVEAPGGRRVRVLKDYSTLLFRLPDGDWVVVYGEEISGDPAERLKRLEKLRGVRWLVRRAEKHRHPWGKAPREDM